MVLDDEAHVRANEIDQTDTMDKTGKINKADKTERI